jgi:hypothetical protein
LIVSLAHLLASLLFLTPSASDAQDVASAVDTGNCTHSTLSSVPLDNDSPIAEITENEAEFEKDSDERDSHDAARPTVPFDVSLAAKGPIDHGATGIPPTSAAEQIHAARGPPAV